MDPLTITTSIITLAEAASKLYKFLQSLRHGDSGYLALCIELRGLDGYIQAINKTLKECQRNPLCLAPIDEDVWEQSGIAIADCQQTVDDLSALAKGIGGSGRSNKLFWRGKVAVGMQIHARDVVNFRDKIHMSTLSLQTLLQVINISISLRSNTSQQKTLRELQQLKQFLETSSHAATNPHTHAFMGRSDAYILRNLQGMVCAARSFHMAASTAASTVDATSTRDGIPEANQRGYAESIAMSLSTPVDVPSYAQYIQMLRSGTKPPTQDRHIPHFDDAPEVWIPPVPELVDRYRTDLTTDAKDSFEGIFSAGLEKMVQKEIHLLEFSRAEDILAQAISRHKIRDADDTYYSQLRTQRAICCFIQDKGRQNAEYIEDLIESRGTDRTMANQLLYALALCHAHHLEYETALRLCKQLWGTLDGSSHGPGRTDVLQILVIIYRLSNQPLLAEAIVEGHATLSSHSCPPTAMEFIVHSDELIGGLFRSSTINESHRADYDFSSDTFTTT
ncbi:uncharacterized protein PG998_010068 [Apiospora kogelbergensis]|uniref:uncharacterized protein n=1 Tax=Apiospora kogelbergensis TaxID=1337665 RepID=UPI003131835B